MSVVFHGNMVYKVSINLLLRDVLANFDETSFKFDNLNLLYGLHSTWIWIVSIASDLGYFLISRHCEATGYADS